MFLGISFCFLNYKYSFIESEFKPFFFQKNQISTRIERFSRFLLTIKIREIIREIFFIKKGIKNESLQRHNGIHER